MSADTAIMPIPGQIDPVPVPRPAMPRADGARQPESAFRKAEIRAALVEAAGSTEAGQAARQAALALDLQSRRHRLRGDERHRQAAARLARRAVRRSPGPKWSRQQVSTDGTRKWLLRTHDGHDFEMVFIPDADRGTLCVSSQVGCTLNCRFCHTGTMRLVRNLDAGEIVGQVMLARDALGEWPTPARRAGCSPTSS